MEGDLSEALKEIVRLGQVTSQVQTVGNTPFIVLPDEEAKVVSLRDYVNNEDAPNPPRKKGIIGVLDAESFITYYSLFSDEHSRVFADETKSTVLGVLDYHGAHENAPRWGQHRVRLDLRFSEEWKKWTSRNGQGRKMTQMEFAEFVEDNAPDISSPSAAEMLEMARTLHAKSEVDFSSAIRTNNGNVQFKYSEQVSGTYGHGNVEIPEEFNISVPVYVGTPKVTVRARLRYRINGGKLTIWYDLLRPDAMQRDAFLATLDTIRETLAIKVINGSPAA